MKKIFFVDLSALIFEYAVLLLMPIMLGITVVKGVKLMLQIFKNKCRVNHQYNKFYKKLFAFFKNTCYLNNVSLIAKAVFNNIAVARYGNKFSLFTDYITHGVKFGFNTVEVKVNNDDNLDNQPGRQLNFSHFIKKTQSLKNTIYLVRTFMPTVHLPLYANRLFAAKTIKYTSTANAALLPQTLYYKFK